MTWGCRGAHMEEQRYRHGRVDLAEEEFHDAPQRNELVEILQALGYVLGGHVGILRDEDLVQPSLWPVRSSRES